MTPATVPPPAPGLVTEYTETGNWLFRWRSYPPVLILAYVVVVTALDPTPAGGAAWRGMWVGSGLALGLLGLVVRAWTVGHVPMGTSGRGTKELRAETLNTLGLYSLVRHPLYLGNYLMWMGVAVFAGKPMAVLVTTLLFWLYYERIMMAEERFLYRGFGDVFGAWAARTPAFVPRLTGFSPSPHPFSLRFCFGRDYQALYAFVVSTAAVELTRSVAAGEGWMLAPAWLAYLAGGTAAYVVLHTLKRRTRLLEAPDR
jgi:protein-S-isoprenylcysteine O-methyltransferase Ste14